MSFKYNPYEGEFNWVLGPGSGTAAVDFITDSGTAVTNGSGEIEIQGGTGINTSGASNIVTINLDSPVTVSNGGTGATTLTDGGIVLGSGTSAVTVTSQPTNGQLLIGSTGVDPVLATLTAGTGVSITNGAGSITIDAGAATPLSFPTDSGTATPAANALTVSGGTNISTSGTGATITIDFNGTLPVASGGTGATTLTGVVIGNGTSAMTATSINEHAVVIGAASDDITEVGPLTNGQLVIGSTGVAPVAATLTAGTGISVSNGAGSITIDAAASVATTYTADTGSATPATNNLNVVGGEGIDTSGATDTLTIAGEDASDTNKGIASFVAADFDVAAGAVSLEDTVVKSVAGDSGTATPSSHSFTIAGSGGVSTSGSGSTITVSSAGITQWVEETTTSRALNANEGVIGNNAGTITMTLPSTAAVGDEIKIITKGAGATAIAQNAGQNLTIGDTTTTTGVGGSATSTSTGDCIHLVCTTANTSFHAIGLIGNWTMV